MISPHPTEGTIFEKGYIGELPKYATLDDLTLWRDVPKWMKRHIARMRRVGTHRIRAV